MNKKWVQSNVHGVWLPINKDNVNTDSVADSAERLKEAKSLPHAEKVNTFDDVIARIMTECTNNMRMKKSK